MVFKYISLRRKQPQKKKRNVPSNVKGSSLKSHHQAHSLGTRVCWSSGILQEKWLFSLKALFSSLIFPKDLNLPPPPRPLPPQSIMLWFRFIWWHVHLHLCPNQNSEIDLKKSHDFISFTKWGRRKKYIFASAKFVCVYLREVIWKDTN